MGLQVAIKNLKLQPPFKPGAEPGSIFSTIPAKIARLENMELLQVFIILLSLVLIQIQTVQQDIFVLDLEAQQQRNAQLENSET